MSTTKPKHESNEDFKARLARMLRDPNDPNAARKSNPLVVRKHSTSAKRPTVPRAIEITPCQVCGGILSHKDGCKYQGRRVHVAD